MSIRPLEPDGDLSDGDSSTEVTRQARLAMSQLNEELTRLQRTIRMAITAKLQQMAGTSLGSLEGNRELVESISQLLESHGLRIRCRECGHPSILRVSPRGKTSGVFVFDHTIDGRRTFHGGKTTLPEIHLVAKPPRQKAKKTPRKEGGKLAS